jgi:hypothetical protein
MYSTLNWPYNLLEDVFGTDFSEKHPPDIEKSVEFVLSKLTNRESLVVEAHYLHNKSCQEVGELIGHSGHGVKLLLVGILKRLRMQRYATYLKLGISNIDAVRNRIVDENNDRLKVFVSRHGSARIQHLGLEDKLCKALSLAHITTVDDLYKLSLEQLTEIKGIGEMGLGEIVWALEEWGFEIYGPNALSEHKSA